MDCECDKVLQQPPGGRMPGRRFQRYPGRSVVGVWERLGDMVFPVARNRTPVRWWSLPGLCFYNAFSNPVADSSRTQPRNIEEKSMHKDPRVQRVAEACPAASFAFFDQLEPCTGNSPFFSCLTLQNSIQTVNSPWICVSALLKTALNGYCNSSRNQTLAMLVGF